MNNLLLKSFISKKFVLLFIFYLVLGCFYISSYYVNKEYFDIFLATLTSDKFTIIFLLPSFLMIYMYLFQYIDERSDIILRLENRKKYLLFHLKCIMKITLFFLVILLLIIGIFCNIIPKSGYGMTLFTQYNVNVWFLVFLSVIRTFLTLITMALLNLLTSIMWNNQKYSLIFGICYIILIFITKGLYLPNTWLSYLNLGFHSFGILLSNDYWEALISSLIYFFIIISLLIVCNFHKIKESKIGFAYRK